MSVASSAVAEVVNTTPITTSYFGLTIESYDYNYSYLGGPVEAFPTISVGVVRSWDVWSPNDGQIEYLDWNSLNPASGVYNWTALNAWIAANKATMRRWCTPLAIRRHGRAVRRQTLRPFRLS